MVLYTIVTTKQLQHARYFQPNIFNSFKIVMLPDITEEQTVSEVTDLINDYTGLQSRSLFSTLCCLSKYLSHCIKSLNIFQQLYIRYFQHFTIINNTNKYFYIQILPTILII